MTTPNPQAAQYYLVQSSPPQRGRTAGSQSGGQGGTGSGGTSPATRQQVKLPAGVPKLFGNRGLLFGCWAVAMIVVGFDDWHNYRLLPRPSRLWYTSLTFGLLMLASLIDAMVPLINALALGYVIMLIWQYYNGAGQFAKTSGGSTA